MPQMVRYEVSKTCMCGHPGGARCAWSGTGSTGTAGSSNPCYRRQPPAGNKLPGIGTGPHTP